MLAPAQDCTHPLPRGCPPTPAQASDASGSVPLLRKMVEILNQRGGDGIDIIVDPGLQRLHRPVGYTAGVEAAAGSIVGRVIRINAPPLLVAGP